MKKENNKFDEILGNLLREYRVQNKLSMQNVADKLNVTRTNIFYYEHGISALSVTQLMKICTLYGIDYITVLKQAQIEMSKHEQIQK